MFWIQAAVMAVGSVGQAMDIQDQEHEQYTNDLLAQSYRNTEIRTEQFNAQQEASAAKRKVGREELALTGKVRSNAAARGIGGQAVEAQINEVNKRANENRSYIQQRVDARNRSAASRINAGQKRLQKAYDKLTFNSTFDFIHNQGMAAGGLNFITEGINSETLQNHLNAHTGQPQETKGVGEE